MLCSLERGITMQRLSLLITFFALEIAVSGCEFSISTATIKSAELARGYQDNKAVDATTIFGPSDTPLHYVVTLGNAPDDTKVKAIWTVVDAGDGQYKISRSTRRSSSPAAACLTSHSRTTRPG